MTMMIGPNISKFTDYKTRRKYFYNTKLKESMNSNSFTRRCSSCCYHQRGFRLGFESSCKLLRDKDRFSENIKKKRVVLVRFNNVKFNGKGATGGRGNDDGGTASVLRNLTLGVALIYLSLTGQLGWIIDAIVSFWCRNCGNEFEVFESMLNYEPQLCPCCNQPFTVFARDHLKPFKEYTFDEAFNKRGLRRSLLPVCLPLYCNRFISCMLSAGKASSRTIIDVEAIVKDAE
ncbi:uncharacterized protein LOC143541286 [Bidens hawaiensis]|uniref:uncharacterized protein LOC143541286 n=1 Tax=Bidens hawaiensis TaxID=980011 RepID=UPI0040492FF2